MSEQLRRDEGQVLGLALIFLVFVALVLAATLTAAASSLHSTQSLTQQRDERYAAEAGILASAARMQADQSQVLLGTDPGTTPSIPDCGFHPGSSDFVVNSMQQVDVSCTPRIGSGAGTDAANRPRYSVLAVISPGAGNEGVIPVNVPNLQVFGPVASTGKCDLPADLPSCITNPPASPWTGKVDPGYAPRSASAPTIVDPVPSCDANTATFSAGTYTRPPSITGCDKPWLFTEGVYYFDFTNPGPHVWTINNTVVGGLTTGWDRAAQPPTLPGACRTEQNLAATDGVQFVFGGDSRMQVGSTGRVELCAQPSTTQQQIAIYGMTPDFSGFPSPTHQFLDPDPQSAVTNDVPPYVPYDKPSWGAVLADNNKEAQASIPAGGAAAITVSDFPALPPGSIIEDATVNVVHHEDPAIQVPGAQPLSIEVKDGTTSLGSQSFPLNVACDTLNPPHCTTSLNIKTALQNDPSLVSRLNVTFTTTAPPTGGPYSSAVEGIQLSLDVDLPTPGYRPLLGCTKLTLGAAADPTQPCPVLSTVPGAALYVQGTVYAPTGGLDVNGRPDDPVRFNRGIIARTVVFRSGNGGSTAGVTAGGAFNRWVVLKASVNGNGNVRIETTVTIDDVQAFIEKRPSPAITYKNWDVK